MAALAAATRVRAASTATVYIRPSASQGGSKPVTSPATGALRNSVLSAVCPPLTGRAVTATSAMPA